jgi:hypothetical protein
MSYANLINPRFIKEALMRVMIGYLAFACGLVAKNTIKALPAGNDQGVSRLYKFSAESNYTALVLAGVVALGVYFGLFYLYKKRDAWFRWTLIGILSLAMFGGLIAPSFARWSGNIDPFHHGEQLGPADGYANGKKAYTDIFILRGAGEDVITPWVSQKIFGRSIGSYYLMTAVLQLVCTILFFWLLSRLFDDTVAWLGVSLWFVLANYVSFFYVRDIFTWLALVLAAQIIMHTKRQKLFIGALAGLATIAMFYSLDRGIFLAALTVLVIATQLLCKRKGPIYTLDLKSLTTRLYIMLPALVGGLTGLIVVVVVLGPTSFKDFFDVTLKVTKYQGLIFNTPYSSFEAKTFLDWLPVIMLIISVILLATLIAPGLRRKRAITRRNLVLLVILVFAAIFYRGATGRPDFGHIAYGSTVVSLAFLLIAFEYFAGYNLNKPDTHVLVAILGVTLILLPTTTVRYQRLLEFSEVDPHHTMTVLKAPRKPDTYWYTPDVAQTTEALKQAAPNGGGLFVLTSNPIYYYTTGLQNPTRFYISWFADPTKLEDELLESLKQSPPEVVLYKAGNYYDRPEFTAMEDRLPKVADWLLQNYPVKTQAGEAEILTR